MDCDDRITNPLDICVSGNVRLELTCVYDQKSLCFTLGKRMFYDKLATAFFAILAIKMEIEVWIS
jgi:hypothetical protein